MILSFKDLTVRKQNKIILSSVSVKLRPGEFKVLLGQNGAGKSTFLRALAGLQEDSHPKVHLGNKKIQSLSLCERAKAVGWLPSHVHLSFPYTVSELVSMGRYPWHRGRESEEDKLKVHKALSRFSLESLTHKNCLHLSSGEQKLTQLARVLSGDQSFFILDEPEAHLDLKNTSRLFSYLKVLAEKQNKGILVASHQPFLARNFATSLLFLKEGKVLEELPKMSEKFSHVLKAAFDLEEIHHFV